MNYEKKVGLTGQTIVMYEIDKAEEFENMTKIAVHEKQIYLTEIKINQIV